MKLKRDLDAPRLFYWLGGLVLLTAVGLFIFFVLPMWRFGGGLSGDPDVKNKTEKIACSWRRAIDGVCVNSESEIYSRAVGVMIENHFDSWPQSGLNEASVVYEAPVEAGITRFLAIYPAHANVAKVGPVRSARPYYLNWASEYGHAPYFHVGGSPEALQLIYDREIVTGVNEMTRGWYFWRASNRLAPHNTYTSSDLWNKAIADYGDKLLSGKYDTWRFDAGIATGTPTTEVNIKFAPPVYSVFWHYVTSTGQYMRNQAGDAHLDESGQQIYADNIIVITTDISVIDEVGRREIRTLGGGNCSVVRDGVMISGRWIKNTPIQRMYCVDEKGEAISMKPGHTWVEIRSEKNLVEYK